MTRRGLFFSMLLVTLVAGAVFSLMQNVIGSPPAISLFATAMMYVVVGTGALLYHLFSAQPPYDKATLNRQDSAEMGVALLLSVFGFVEGSFPSGLVLLLGLAALFVTLSLTEGALHWLHKAGYYIASLAALAAPVVWVRSQLGTGTEDFLPLVLLVAALYALATGLFLFCAALQPPVKEGNQVPSAQ